MVDKDQELKDIKLDDDTTVVIKDNELNKNDVNESISDKKDNINEFILDKTNESEIKNDNLKNDNSSLDNKKDNKSKNEDNLKNNDDLNIKDKSDNNKSDDQKSDKLVLHEIDSKTDQTDNQKEEVENINVIKSDLNIINIIKNESKCDELNTKSFELTGKLNSKSNQTEIDKSLALDKELIKEGNNDLDNLDDNNSVSFNIDYYSQIIFLITIFFVN